jgi:hypothetical protein
MMNCFFTTEATGIVKKDAPNVGCKRVGPAKVSSQSWVTTCKLRFPAFVTLGKYSVSRALSTLPAVIPVSSTANRTNAVRVLDTGSVVPVPFNDVKLRFVTTGGFAVL